MIQIAVLGFGFMVICQMLSTPEQRAKARRDVKVIEPYCIAVTIAGIGFVGYAWYIG
jgi:hypothetical protein